MATWRWHVYSYSVMLKLNTTAETNGFLLLYYEKCNLSAGLDLKVFI